MPDRSRIECVNIGRGLGRVLEDAFYSEAYADQGQATERPDRVARDRADIDRYLLDYLAREIDALDAMRPSLRRALGYKALEFAWSMQTLAGRAYLHDGSRNVHENSPVPPRPIDLAQPAFRSPRLYFDCTTTFRNDVKTGIQRVVRSLAREMAALGAMPVTIADGVLTSAFSFDGKVPEVRVQSGDRIILSEVGSFSALETVKRLFPRENVTFVLYDVIPLIHSSIQTRAFLRHWIPAFNAHLAAAGNVVCVSGSSRNDLLDHAARHPGFLAEGTRVGTMRLGCEVDEISGEPSPAAKILAAAGDFLLSVGTLEPRKAQSVAIEALEKVWSRGGNAALVIVGRPGWLCRNLVDRIKSHPEFGKRLHWLDDCSDSDLDHLYRNARALIATSVAEGHGLPLFEAARRGAPIIASDIPVFRELCGDGAAYFPILDSDALAGRIETALVGLSVLPNFALPSWSDAAEDAVAFALGSGLVDPTRSFDGAASPAQPQQTHSLARRRPF